MIRRYAEADLEAVLGVWRRASDVAHPFLSDEFLASEARAIAELYMPAAETWVDVEGDELTGFIALLGKEVGALFVDPARHGEGIGRRLMDHARALRGELEVEVFAENAIGRRFYARYGFEFVREHVHEATGKRLHRLRLGRAG